MFNLYKQKLREWMNRHADSKYSRAWLGFLAFFDACISPIPPDALLIPMLLLKNKRWFSVAFITAGWSVIGGVAGFFIGFFLFDTVGEWVIAIYSLEDEFIVAGEMFNKHAFITVFIAAFTPLPYNVFAISGGFFGVSFVVFVLASILGRFLRYFAMAFILKRFGEMALRAVSKNFNITFFVILILLIAVAAIYYF